LYKASNFSGYFSGSPPSSVLKLTITQSYRLPSFPRYCCQHWTVSPFCRSAINFCSLW
jgi:hypothetical protein